MKQFDDLAAEARRRYVALLIEAAEGGEPDPAKALQIAVAAGRSASQLAADVRIACDRRAAVAEADAADWDTKIAKLQSESVAAKGELDKAQAAFDRAQSALRTASETYDTASRRANGARTECQRQEKELADTLRKSGSPDDWQVFRLDGEPKPVVKDWRDDPTLVIDLGGGSQVRPLASTAGVAL